MFKGDLLRLFPIPPSQGKGGELFVFKGYQGGFAALIALETDKIVRY